MKNGIYGKDIADPKGGVFTATKGLSEKFGTKEFLTHLWLNLNIWDCSWNGCYRLKPVVGKI
ncbi:MAG: hypothetical protein CM15mP127_16070 [Gammaproteobacteria bacterium]|nr:MAG: hypothetical protein CM15mP127_16070 [Gammaproteobacteria bacterium]